MFIVVSYDISDDHRRKEISSCLENYGERVQRSVFECHLEESQWQELHGRLSKMVDPCEDSIRHYRLCQEDAVRVILEGTGNITRDWDYYVV